MIEVHNDPKHALCDGAQSIVPEAFDDIVKSIDVMLPIVNKHRDL
jgi:3-deoxy-7-phosphoheptulonate synthase